MKLTNVLWRWKKRLPRGHLWRGKYRLYKKVTPLMLANKIHEFELEEKNMFYLRNPYLNPEQSALMSHLFNHEEKRLAKQEKEKLKWYEHRNLGDRFGFLKITDAWDV